MTTTEHRFHKRSSPLKVVNPTATYQGYRGGYSDAAFFQSAGGDEEASMPWPGREEGGAPSQRTFAAYPALPDLMAHDESNSSSTSLDFEDCNAVFERPTRDVAKNTPSTSNRKAWWGMGLIFAFTIMVLSALHYTSPGRLTYLFHEARQTINDLRQLALASPDRELLLSQERLLLDLARHRHVGDPDLLHHLQAARDELAHVTEQLEQERAQRQAAEADAREAWGELKLTALQHHGADTLSQKALSKLSRTLVKHRFGAGPYYVEFAAQLPGQVVSVISEPRHFTIELAPDEHVVPTTKLVFLEQVAAGLWDGASFYLNTADMLVAQPVSTRHEHHASMLNVGTLTKNLDQMKAQGLDHVPVHEYNADYPHAAYTLGLGVGDGDSPSRPGPNFYINKADHSRTDVGTTTPDPCFARVIIGTDAIDEIGKLRGPHHAPLYIGVEIVSATIVHDLQHVVGGREYLEQLKLDRAREARKEM